MDKPTRVLIVDDDGRTARLLARMLREDGYQVDVELNGDDALRRLEHDEMPDVLIADPRVQGRDGISVALHARTRRPHLPVVFITEYPLLVHRSKQLNPSPRVLTKPIRYDDLTRELRAAEPRFHRRSA
jgi:CheY-like chemotaxis protein